MSKVFRTGTSHSRSQSGVCLIGTTKQFALEVTSSTKTAGMCESIHAMSFSFYVLPGGGRATADMTETTVAGIAVSHLSTFVMHCIFLKLEGCLRRNLEPRSSRLNLQTVRIWHPYEVGR